MHTVKIGNLLINRSTVEDIDCLLASSWKIILTFSRKYQSCLLFIHKQVPIVPYGGATSIEGHTLSPNGGVCIDMSMMNVCTDLFVFYKSMLSWAFVLWN